MFGGARNVRFNPDTVTPQELPGVGKLDDEKAQRKIEEIREGGALQREYPPFPPVRPYQDVIWVILFFITVGATLGAGYQHSGAIYEAADEAGSSTMEQNYVASDTSVAAESQSQEQIDYDTTDPNDVTVQTPNIWTLVIAGSVGAGGAIVTSFAFVLLAHQCPACVVYTSLLAGPVLAVMMGGVLIFMGLSMGGGTIAVIMGVLMMALGVIMGVCVFCCYKHLIPFMIKLTEVVADVIDDHFCLLGVALFGAVLSCLWTIAVFIAFIGICLTHEVYTEDMRNVSYVLTFCTTLVLVWGSQVCTNVCHVTYCGVFGRWYFGLDKMEGGANSPLAPSFKVAITTSLGSICMGSFLVALIRAVQAVIDKAKDQAAEDGNYVVCILLCIMECCVKMIGDILEYFNEWSYVQCAFRGVKFCDAARITYSMFTCANLQFIVCDLLLGNLTGLGALLCAVVGGVCGALMGAALEGSMAALWGAALGVFAGFISGVAALSIITSGIKAILTAWAENPNPLMISHPDVHEEFEARIAGKLQNEGMFS